MKMKSFLVISTTILSICFAMQQGQTQEQSWAYNQINIPLSTEISSDDSMDEVIVAVVDDAFRLSHKEIKDFIYHNPHEIANNQLDDDGNGYVDDVSGWDISDDDADVSVLSGMEKKYYHGTYISSIITKIARLYNEKGASKKVKILPIKVLSDGAELTYFHDGYKGIKYAMDNGADIICLAWSGGNPTKEEKEIVAEAVSKGILLIASVGNFQNEEVLNPAQLPSVLAVTAVGQDLRKIKLANYGNQSDIAAPGEAVFAAHPEKNNAYFSLDGTSPAAAIVAGCAAVLKSINTSFTTNQITEALMNSSTLFDNAQHKYNGKMGAGMVNLEAAIQYLTQPSEREKMYSPLRSKGIVHYTSKSNVEHKIAPLGSYHGFTLLPNVDNIQKLKNSSFDIIVEDSIWNTYSFAKMPKRISVPATALTIKTNATLKKKDVFSIAYEGVAIDSTTLYCKGVKKIVETAGIITDGSEKDFYSNLCTCKWIISVPKGKRIKFNFDQIDTEPNIDFVYLIDGKTAIPSNIFAKFSGTNKPPVVTSFTNEVLVWFVTDGKNTGKGWQFSYKTVD